VLNDGNLELSPRSEKAVTISCDVILPPISRLNGVDVAILEGTIRLFCRKLENMYESDEKLITWSFRANVYLPTLFIDCDEIFIQKNMEQAQSRRTFELRNLSNQRSIRCRLDFMGCSNNSDQTILEDEDDNLIQYEISRIDTPGKFSDIVPVLLHTGDTYEIMAGSSVLLTGIFDANVRI
jgi:hypothetical protein